MQIQWIHMRLISLEVAREEDNQNLFLGPLTKLQKLVHYQPNFSIFQLMQWDIVVSYSLF